MVHLENIKVTDEAKIIVDGSIATWKVERVEMDWRQGNQVGDCLSN